MEIEILKQTENKLLERIEVQTLVKHDGEPVPTRDAVLSKLAAMLNKERDQVVLIKMEAKYGIGHSDALFHVYESAEQALKTERPYLLKRSGLLKKNEE
ncbi:MAG: 30S ribosomal protein S24e [Candidatus Heimdallarchaeaceae archaeon]